MSETDSTTRGAEETIPRKWGMSEETHRLWDTICKVIAPILTVAGILVGIRQFNQEQQNIRLREVQTLGRNDALEFKRKIWERQNTAYIEIAKAVGKVIAVVDQPAKFGEAAQNYEELYRGVAILNDDNAVAELMIQFRAELVDFKKKQSSVDRLKVRADALVKALQASSQSTWKQLNGDALK